MTAFRNERPTLDGITGLTLADLAVEELESRLEQDYVECYPLPNSSTIVQSDAAPELHISVIPDTLWPPNNKLIPIAVTIQVADDHDLQPLVKLVSITCNDACDPTRDVAGAQYGTDDREFQLRATRSGQGSGRIYLITYTATDTGNKTTTATATVTVPHDQGR